MQNRSRLGIALGVLLITLSGDVCRGEVPQFFRESQISAADLAQAVNHFVALGEESAARELIKLAAGGDRQREFHGVYVPDRLGCVLRILFEPRNQAPLRGPLFGGLELPYETMPSERWPLYPVAASGRSYFVLSEGYILAGVPENPVDYLAYCRSNGIFRHRSVPVPTQAQALADATALRKSAAWKAIQWKGEHYTLSEDATWAFVKAQAESIK